jgi:hypothetical protein
LPAQDEPVSVWVGDGDPPAIPVRVPAWNAATSPSKQTVYEVRIDLLADIEDEQVFLGWCGGCVPVRVRHELEVPSRLGPSDDQEPMLA